MKTMQGERAINDLRRLIKAPAGEKTTLKPLEPKGAVEARKGRGDFREDQRSPGGVASPLVEDDYDSRMYWSDRTLTSVDGLLSFVIRPIRGIFQRDANNAVVEQQFAEPPV
ncbi:hypothetical protein [Ectopseudomonas mendocina]|uniref:hypothetical protein n=1 Tax=Ectopseudomonas mendocina TaxID=300 RepID=UPI003F0365E3